MTVPTNNEEREALAEALAQVFEMGTLPNFFREADAVLAILAARRLPVSGDNAERPSAVTNAMLRAAVLHLKEYYEVRSSHGNLRWIVPDGEVRAALEAALSASQPREAAPSDTDRFKPTHRVRERGSEAWIDVRADGVEPQTYYDRDGKTIYAGIWFRNMEVERLTTSQPVQVVVSDEMVEKAAVGMYFEDCGNTPDARERATDEFDAQFRQMARAALSAALGGSNHAE